jgi:hypothetical protein
MQKHRDPEHHFDSVKPGGVDRLHRPHGADQITGMVGALVSQLVQLDAANGGWWFLGVASQPVTLSKPPPPAQLKTSIASRTAFISCNGIKASSDLR